jgi:uncharacterized protein
MRLTPTEKKAIYNSAVEVFGKNSKVFLFGSRVDDTKKGGDIDLYIETVLSSEEALEKKIDFLVDLKIKIGDRKIDVVVRGSDSSPKPVYDIAQAEGLEIRENDET